MRWKILTLAVASALPFAAAAQKSTAEGIAEYRAMLADGNPAELFEAKGEAIWKEARGPKKASLEKCDLGQGPGVVKGAFVELPRYFADTKRVQDLESRLLTCMETLQGFNAAEIAKTRLWPWRAKNAGIPGVLHLGRIQAMKFNLPQAHAQEKLMYEVGEKLFYMRGGPYDFSCASCHGEDNKRVRLQDLPNLTKNPGAGDGFGAWPAYRVSSGTLWGMQRRLNDCYRQQRFPYPGFRVRCDHCAGRLHGRERQGRQVHCPCTQALTTSKEAHT
jgi:sulfur-oxidizing protein SoxA